MDKLIELLSAVPRLPHMRLAAPVNFFLSEGEHVAITGLNASGKTLLVNMLTGKSLLAQGNAYFHRAAAIRYLPFRDAYGTADATYYYQQRWNMGDQGELQTVSDSLGLCSDGKLRDELIQLFDFEQLIDKPLIYLSSGELRKFQLMKALFADPEVLILDNPYIGLDASTRQSLTALLKRLSEQRRISLILVTPLMDDIPEFITHVYQMKDKVCLPRQTRAGYLAQLDRLSYDKGLPEEMIHAIAQLPQPQTSWSAALSDAEASLPPVVEMDHVGLRYGERTILKDLDWIIRAGERWALSGENGAGKSALLSLVCADNPQAYACRIHLFGRRRGSGESIWEIKRHIGYISPEMHRAYMKNHPAIDIVASGLHDSIGLYVRPRPEDYATCEFWMKIFGIEMLRDRPFLELSSGEQRLCLLARAFVKDPSLLILDEPLHGLDSTCRARVRSIIECFCQRPGKTLVMASHYREELPSCIQKEMVLYKDHSYHVSPLG